MIDQPRKADVTRKVVVDLKKVEERVPKNSQGDPAFQLLGTEKWWEACTEHRNSPFANGSCHECAMLQPDPKLPSIRDVFTDEQVVALVNRALYQMMYSREAHKNRAQQQRDREKPVKEMFKQLYPGTSWAQATESQIKHAVIEVMKGEEHHG